MPERLSHSVVISLEAGAIAMAGIAIDPTFYPLAAGAFMGLVIHPDLDQVRHGYWKLYGDLSKHRGVSHWPIVGTIERLVYAFWWLIIPAIVLFVLHPEWSEWSLIAGWVTLAFVGLCFSDLTHWGLDKLDKFMGGRL